MSTTDFAKETSRDNTAVRSFRVGFSDAELNDLRTRIKATRWPERETVTDDSQGVRLALMQALAQHWATDYDWRKCETRLNALPQFITEIDGLDIHFIHVRSRHEDALPLIVTHGWPGSIIEQLKIIDPLTNPTAHGASASDAFHLVIPSLPGHGFSGKPTSTGWDPARTARAWTVLMKRLGYTRFVAQGGDWGAAVTQTMGTSMRSMWRMHSSCRRDRKRCTDSRIHPLIWRRSQLTTAMVLASPDSSDGSWRESHWAP